MNGFGAIEWLARVGFLVKGVLYIVVGALASMAARAGGRVGKGGAHESSDNRSAVRCCSSSYWASRLRRLARPSRTPRSRPPGPRLAWPCDACELRGSRSRARGVGWQAFRLYRGLSAASGTSEREVATEAFRWPLGDWLVVLAGLGAVGLARAAGLHGNHLPIQPQSRCRKDSPRSWRVGGRPRPVRRGGRAVSLCCSDRQSWSPVGPAIRGKSAPRRRHSAPSLHNREGGQLASGVTATGFVAYGFYEIIQRAISISDTSGDVLMSLRQG